MAGSLISIDSIGNVAFLWSINIIIEIKATLKPCKLVVVGGMYTLYSPFCCPQSAQTAPKNRTMVVKQGRQDHDGYRVIYSNTTQHSNEECVTLIIRQKDIHENYNIFSMSQF